MKTIFLAAVAFTLPAGAALAQQQQPEATERRVLAERVCKDGATTTVVVTGNLISVEYFSAPRADGTVSGYEDAYDLKEIAEAKAQFDALKCPEDQ